MWMGDFVQLLPSLTISPLDDKKHKRLYNNLKTKEEDLIPDIIFEEHRMRDTYLDKYDSIKAEISQVTSFDKSTDLSTTYLGKTDVTRDQAIKAEGRFPSQDRGTQMVSC